MLCDLHTHTIVSGHAYSTLNDNLKFAKKNKIRFLGASEHSERMPGSCKNIYFSNMRILKRYYDGVYLLKGAEANIIDYNGNIDFEKERHFRSLDYIIASLHGSCIENGGIKNNTKALISAMDHEKVAIIGHPDDDNYPIDKKELVLAAKEKNILLELNNTSLRKHSVRKNAKENIIELLDLAEQYDINLIMNTDAHVDYEVGNFGLMLDLLESLDYPKERIINFDKDESRLFEYLNIDKEKFYQEDSI
jgi:putative hydrolase